MIIGNFLASHDTFFSFLKSTRYTPFSICPKAFQYSIYSPIYKYNAIFFKNADASTFGSTYVIATGSIKATSAENDKKSTQNLT